MFTSGMYERLSEWMGNVSVLFLGSVVVPFFAGGSVLNGDSVTRGGILTLASLWLSLRFSRMSEGGRE